MRLQHGVAILMAASFLILGYTLVSPSALPEFWAMQQKKKDLEARMLVLESRLAFQKEKIVLLSGKTSRSRAYLEQIARSEYGFVGKEETLLILHN